MSCMNAQASTMIAVFAESFVMHSDKEPNSKSHLGHSKVEYYLLLNFCRGRPLWIPMFEQSTSSIWCITIHRMKGGWFLMLSLGEELGVFFLF